jgi:endonuclease G
VGYVLTKKDLDGKAERLSAFKPDKLLKHPGAKDIDYVRSGFSRGHMAPAEDFSRSKEAIASTFVLSNIVPQYQQVNGGRWAQLEMAVRNLVRAAGAAYVFTGPIFDEPEVDTIGDGQVGVPTHTFKVVLTIGPGSGERKMYAVVMPNAEHVAGTVNSFATTVRDVEDKTGFDFFAALDRQEQDRLESAREQFPESATKRPRPAKNNRQ